MDNHEIRWGKILMTTEDRHLGDVGVTSIDFYTKSPRRSHYLYCGIRHPHNPAQNPTTPNTKPSLPRTGGF